MPRRFIATLLCGTCVLFALASCGTEKAAGTGEFATVYATATSPGSDIDSDVATWVDSTGAKATACGSGSLATATPDSASYTITSAAFSSPNTGSSSPILASDLIIDKITVRLTPADTATPALPAGYQTTYASSGQRVTAGGSTTISVRIASDELKSFLRTQLGSQSLDCSNQGVVYKYNLTVSFEALEVNTGRIASITPPGSLVVRFSDFIDK